MISVDAKTLTDVIGTCFNLSMDARIPQPQQSEFLVAGKQLRGSLVNLISAKFNDGTQAVTNANAQLATVNQQLSQAVNSLNAAASGIQQVTQLVGVLDGLLKLAVSFH